MENGTIVIPPYVYKVLGLENAAAMVYGIIYGFTIGKQGKFYGNLRFISEITGLQRTYVCNILKKLTDKGYIKKTVVDTLKNEYHCVPYDELVANGLITLPEKQEKPKRKTKQKAAANTAKIITDCETVENASNPITDDKNAVKTQENENKPPDFELTAVDEKPKIRQPESEVLDPEKQLRLETWEFYKQAYLERYGIEPVRNAKVNRNILDFVKQVGANAPQMIYFFVFHNNSWYVQKGHDTGTLLANVQAIARDWAKGYQTTQAYAKQGESVATAQMAAQGAIELLNSIREEKAKRQQGA